jgi:hypothetical protein
MDRIERRTHPGKKNLHVDVLRGVRRLVPHNALHVFTRSHRLGQSSDCPPDHLERQLRQSCQADYELVDTVKTELSARSMALDPQTKKIYLPTADIETVPTMDPKKPFVRKIKLGTFRILVVSP